MISAARHLLSLHDISNEHVTKQNRNQILVVRRQQVTGPSLDDWLWPDDGRNSSPTPFSRSARRFSQHLTTQQQKANNNYNYQNKI